MAVLGYEPVRGQGLACDTPGRAFSVANEITATGSLSFNKSGRSADLSRVGIQFDMTGLDFVQLTQNIGLTEEAILLGDVTTNGWCILINRSASYEIRIRPATGVADMISIPPGGFAGPFKLKATAPFAIAITGVAVLEILLIEE